jgi:hypothetical protein
MAKRKQKLNIDCSYDKLVPVKDLKPNPGNPNKHNKQQIELLAVIIKATKWRYPIYCDVIVKRWEKFTGKKAKREKVAA